TVVGGHARRQGVRRQSYYVETLIAHHTLMMSKSGRGVEMETDHAPALPQGLSPPFNRQSRGLCVQGQRNGPSAGLFPWGDRDGRGQWLSAPLGAFHLRRV